MFSGAKLNSDPVNPILSISAAALLPDGTTGRLLECGHADNSCAALVLETALFGKTGYNLAPMIRRAGAFACLAGMRDVLESNLRPAVGAGGESEQGRVDSLFVYERDGPTFLEDFVSEVKCCRKPGEGFGAIAYSALAMHLGVNIHYRIPHKTTSGSEWWSAAPDTIAPEFIGFQVRAYHTGYWHWKLALPPVRECGNGCRPWHLELALTAATHLASTNRPVHRASSIRPRHR